ncbi:MAG: NifB/NifX family molybdenum-iron cluster-binding protein [Candidatus Cloacimonetes bacterium]|nr:NifB/NifX family molybdenum-iron cluster-binding protein [Candidatus Cloacimonadota bacterium]
MKIAFTTTGTDWNASIDPRFGRTEYILIYDEEKDEITNFDNRDIADVAHGAGPKTAQLIFDLKPQVLITGNGPGGNAAAVLTKTDLKIYIGAGNMTVKEAYEAYKTGILKQS